MRRTILLAALLLPAPAQAATLPAASEPGITVSRAGGGAYAVGFSPHLYREFARGGTDLICAPAVERSPAVRAPEQFRKRVVLPRRRSLMRLRPPAGADVCELVAGGQIAFALSARGRRFLADYDTANGIEQLLGPVVGRSFRRKSWAPYRSLSRRVREEVAHLSSAEGRPRGKRYGYYTDGRGRMTIAGVSPTGRRLFISFDGGVAATDIVGLEAVFSDPGATSGTLPIGPFPPAGTPLPDATVSGVTATQTGREVAISFSGADAEAAYRRLAGHRVSVSCTEVGTTLLGLSTAGTAGFPITAPSEPTTLRFDAGSGRFATCSLTVTAGAPVVQVAIGERGRAPLEDGLTSQALLIVSERAAAAGTGDYPTAESLSASLSNAVVALASPSDTPSDRRVGVYSDGRRHLAVVARTMTGRRLYVDYSGDVLSTNIGSVPDLTI